MEQGFVARVRGRALANAGGVRAALEACLVLLIVLVGISCFAFLQSYRQRIAVLSDKIAAEEAALSEYRAKLNGATAEQVANHIQELTKLLADTQKRLQEAENKPVSSNSDWRDPRQLYQDSQPIAAVGEPSVDVSRRTITFPIVTSRIILGINKSYEFQNWKVTCGATRLYNTIREATAREFTYSPLTCKIVASR